MNSPIQGIIVATLTPYAAGRVDLGIAREHAAFLVEHGIPGLAPAGTTGEFLFLDREEKIGLVRAAVEGARGRAGVVAGIWAETPEDVATLAAAAAESGADAVFLTTPIYYRYDDAALFRWYERAASASPLPLYCYNIPQYAGNSISRELFARLLAAGVAGIKDSTGNAEILTAELEVAAPRRAGVYGASDGFCLEARRLGATGFISALANIFPGEFLRIWEGDEAAQQFISQVRSAVKSYGGIAALKRLLTHRGFDFGPSRLPFSELDETARAEIDRVMQQVRPPG